MAKSVGVKITTRFGGKVKTWENKQLEAAAANISGDMSERIEKYVEQVGIANINEKMPKVAASMQRRGIAELARLMNFIGSNLIGRRPGPFRQELGAQQFGADTSEVRNLKQINQFGLTNMDGHVVWRELTERYLKRRKRKRSSDPNYPTSFWKRTGALQQFFLENAELPAQKLGGVTVEWHLDPKPPEGSKIPIGNLKINILPAKGFNLKAAGKIALGDFDTGRTSNTTLTKLVFKDNEQVMKKLLGRRGRRLTNNDKLEGGGLVYSQRPLFAPALAVWALQRIPRAIESAIGNFFKGIQRGS
jgi:hypothetical protein